MGQLCIAQAHHMAPRRERARLILRPGGPRNFGDQVLGNKIANLLQDAELGAGWGYFEFIHPCRVAGARKSSSPFSQILLDACGKSNQVNREFEIYPTKSRQPERWLRGLKPPARNLTTDVN